MNTAEAYTEVAGGVIAPQELGWTALLGFRGSVAHGMYVPDSDPNSIDDVDLMGIVVPGGEYYLGLREFGSRGTVEVKQGRWDIVLYEARKMFSLLAQGNPNVLSLLWLRDEDYLVKTVPGEMLIANRSAFMSKGMYQAFVGYAHGQLQRMTRTEHRGYMGEKRKALVEKYGYDCKNAAHLIRLLKMGGEALRFGTLQVYRDGDAEELLSIKRGEWQLESVQRYASLLFYEIEQAKDASPLPEAVDMNVVNKLCREFVSSFWLERIQPVDYEKQGVV